MIAHFFKRNKTKPTQIESIQKKNQTIIPRFLTRIWPRWVYLQSSPTSTLFNLHENPDSLINVSQRNWTYITAPGSDHSIQIDPQGLLTGHFQTWSLDVWIGNKQAIISPSQLDSVKQTFDPNTPSLTTTFHAHHAAVSLESFIIPLPHHEHVACQTILIENPTLSKLELSCFLAIRPYTPEGLSTINTINYHSQHAFLVNNAIGLVLDKKPDNIVCLPFLDGDCSEHANRWEMVLQAQCELGLASAIAEYRFSLEPGEKKEFSCKIPLQISHYSQNNTAKLSTSLTQIQSLNIESEKKLIGKIWKEALPTLDITLPDSALQSLIQKNLFHLISHKDTYTHKHVVELLHILSIQTLYTENLDCETSFKQAFQSLDHSSVYEVALFTVILLDHAERNPDHVWIKKQFLALQKDWAPLLNHKKSKHNHALNHLPTRTMFWLIAAARKAAHYVSTQPTSKEFIDRFHEVADSFLQKITEQCDRLEKTQVYRPIIPISETEWTDARLVDALCGVFPFQIIDPTSQQVTETLRWLECNSMIHSSILYNQTDPTGLCTHQNARLAQIYIARKDPKAWPILEWLIKQASPAGTWPGALHPTYLVGCDGEGHSRETMVEFLRLIRQCLITEDTKTLRITPFIPKNWLEKGLNLRIKNIPTLFGPISFETTHIGSTIEYSFSPKFHTLPECIEISLPTVLAEATCKGKTIPFQNNTAYLSGNETACTLTMMSK